LFIKTAVFGKPIFINHIQGVSRMKKIHLLAVACVVGAVVFTGCEKAPQAEIEKAKQAVATAETDAAAYAADQLNAAKASLNDALAAVKTEDAKLFKNFTAAKAKLAATVTAAEDAAVAAAKNKEALKMEASDLVAKAKTAVEGAKKAVNGAKKKATKEMKALVTDAEKALAAAETAITGSDFAGAKTSATTAIDKAGEVEKQLPQPKAAAAKAPAHKAKIAKK
jgi:hypothetical protein